jgi:FkbM family methyltransferase
MPALERMSRGLAYSRGKLSAARIRLMPIAMYLVLRPKARDEMVRLGSSYGGWWVPRESLQVGRVAYCFGAGEDVSFDLELVRHGLKVRVFDPTPRAVEYVSSLTAPGADGLVFEAIGVWHTTGSIRFYAPQDDRNVSHSAVNLQKTNSYFDAPVERLNEINHRHSDEPISILKLDIEGAEHVVIEGMLKDGIRPEVLCVELDQPCTTRTMLSTVRLLRQAGYGLERIEAWNYTFRRHEP